MAPVCSNWRRGSSYAVLAAVGVPFLLLALAAIAGNMLQHRLVWSAESLKPKFSKISPGAGLKRIFGKQAVANFLKGLFKLVAVGVVMTAMLWPERHRLEVVHELRSGDAPGRDHQHDPASVGRGGGSWRWSRSPIISSSTGNGTSGRRCRCRR